MLSLAPAASDAHSQQTIAAQAQLVGTRPQEPKPPFPYASADISIKSVSDVQLSCTLFTPDGAGPFPAAVFASGSGPDDRNAGGHNHKPFLVLADHLARNRIASLRCDDRGVANSTGDFSSATTADFANDAEAAVHFLRSQKAVKPNGIGIIGQSEGGLTAPMVAARSGEVAFIVMLAGSGVPGDSILLLQSRLSDSAAGVPAEVLEVRQRVDRIAYSIVKQGGDYEKMVTKIEDSVRSLLPTFPAHMQNDAAVIQLMLPMMLKFTPWFEYFMAYDPVPALRKVKVPVLALIGTLDTQVPHRENLSAIERALREGGNRDFRVLAMPGLNHQFQKATSGLRSEYGTINETISPAALELITAWIRERFR